jgi:hypothetical protein
MKQLAEMMCDLYFSHTPTRLDYSEWHLPFVKPEEDLAEDVALKVSTARCARVSYMRHDGKPSPINEDIDLHNGLLESGHMSPTEHQGTPSSVHNRMSGNFRGWIQYRKTILNENRTNYRRIEFEDK